METKENDDINEIGSHISVARFELNRTQTSLILVVSLMGVMILPFSIVGNILFNLFQYIFETLPMYLLESHFYHEDYLIYHLTPIITSLILNTLLLIFSIYGLKRTIKQKVPDKRPHRKFIPLNRRVIWFGLKLSHGQSIFIFCVSLIGILYIIPELIYLYITPEFMFGLFSSLCTIPTGPSSGTGHLLLDTNVPRAILITFIILCLFSLIFITRRGKPISSSTRIAKNYSIFIFIVSFVVLIFLSARIFCHLALFNPEISDMLGISSNPTNPYQNSDFIKTFVFFIIFLTLMITSIFLKEKSYEKRNSKKELTWLHKKLTPQRAIILISLAVFSFIIIFFDFLFYITAIIMMDFHFISLSSIIYYTIFLVIFIFCYYPIGKLLKDNHLDRFINEIKSESNFETNWFTSRLDKLNSIIFLSVSCGLIVFYIYQLIMNNIAASFLLNDIYSSGEYLLYSFPLITLFIGAILLLNVYTIRKTLPSLKSHE
ncbi:MAG: hypothetical protein ACFFCV_10455 [Promethearchaeota archaeon]